MSYKNQTKSLANLKFLSSSHLSAKILQIITPYENSINLYLPPTIHFF